MAIKEETALAVSHRLTLEGRRRLAATGVTDVASFDETAAALETAQGTLILRGRAARGAAGSGGGTGEDLRGGGQHGL